jgi:hypothetical protein
MCELEPPVSTVPDGFITGLEFHVLPVSNKYLQEDTRSIVAIVAGPRVTFRHSGYANRVDEQLVRVLHALLPR